MKKQKFYAVRVGRKPGIYLTWPDCQKQVIGSPGAVFKSFESLSEAEAFLAGTASPPPAPSDDLTLPENGILAYVDGSYRNDTQQCGYGMIILDAEGEHAFAEEILDEPVSMRNVTGEICGAKAAMRYALEHGYANLVIFHDYQGIASWCTGSWKAGLPETQAYRDFYLGIQDRLHVEFRKVRGHSGNLYNEKVDKLARSSIGL